MHKDREKVFIYYKNKLQILNLELHMTKRPEFRLLYFGLRHGQKCHSKVMHRKEVTHSNGSHDRKSRGRKLANKMGQGKKNPMILS